ncbi:MULTISPECIES: hypothetical protein [unclassified Bradyrhizobium]|uniref:tetratricopeptide repeat protein n=1 Tax=unclassified Bradyrhizobium TaxID=2631580 RepID=UPI002915E9F1|nr:MULTISPECIES: hypothetical protein [unclassified Bradyrhizobium]
MVYARIFTLQIFLQTLFVVTGEVKSSYAYVIDGMTLGEKLPASSYAKRFSECSDSRDFDGYQWCKRIQPRPTSLGRGQATTQILRSKDGTLTYLMTTVAPVSLSKSIVQAEIDELSRENKEQPIKLDWYQTRDGITAVIGVWGKLELARIHKDDIGRTDALIDPLEDPDKSTDQGLPIFRVAGEAGYVYCASFDASGRGHRHYVAANMAQAAITTFVPTLEEAVRDDQTRSADDFSLWIKVAQDSRRIAVAASPAVANRELDKIFQRYRQKKLQSRVWALLPLGVSETLGQKIHWTEVNYGPNTLYPEIRERILEFLAANPKGRFSEFLYYTIGEFEKGLAVNPSSVIKTELRYAMGYAALRPLLEGVVKRLNDPEIHLADGDSIESVISLLNHEARYRSTRLSAVDPEFVSRAAVAKPLFELVLNDESSRLADDAAYMIGWLAFHQNKMQEALGYAARAMNVGNGDYSSAATRLVLRIFERYTPQQQVAALEEIPALSQQPAIWYKVARDAYRRFDYTYVIDVAERALRYLQAPSDQLPATTDPILIAQALKKIKHKYADDPNFVEIPYVLQASREIVELSTSIKSIADSRPDAANKIVRMAVIKYSRLTDATDDVASRKRMAPLAHRDLRQALHLIDISLAQLPKKTQLDSLREWLLYRKVRILVSFDPRKVPTSVVDLSNEFPGSGLLDDAMAEQLYSEGVRLKNVEAAERTFQALVDKFPRANAIDNAYTWMAIIYHCANRAPEEHRMNFEIIRRFPTTRHALYAAKREAVGGSVSCSVWSDDDENL